MKILFGLNQEAKKDIELKILNEYEKINDESFEFDKDFYLDGIKRRLNESYDILVLNEELEKDNFVSTAWIDNLTDKYSDLRIILVVNGEHRKDFYIRKLYSMGVYDIIFSDDLSYEIIADLISKGRTKVEAKIYLELEDIREDLEDIDQVVSQFESDSKNIVEIYEDYAKKYDDKQMLFLTSILPKNAILVLEASQSQTFRDYMDKIKSLDEKKEKVEKKPPTIKTETKVITKIEKEYINLIPEDYKKVIVLLGERKTGVTTLVNMFSNYFSLNKKVLVIDSAINGLFSMKSWGNENIENKEDYYYIQLNNNLKVLKPKNNESIMDLIQIHRFENDLIFIDGDLDLSYNVLNWVDMIFVVNTLDIMEVKPTKEYLKKIISKGINPKKIHLLINKYLKCKQVGPKDILTLYREPIPYIEENKEDTEDLDVLDINEKYFVVNFDEDFYKELLGSYIYIDKDIAPVESIKNQIKDICTYIYPLKKNLSNKKKINIMERLKLGMRNY